MPDPYLFALALGGAGLGAMALLGAHGHAPGAHGHIGADGHAAGGDGAGHGGAGHGGAEHAAAGHGTTQGSGEAHAPQWLMLLSPRVAFSALIGFGAVGLALRGLLGGPLLFLAAVAGGIAFEALLVRPLWGLLLRFASQPALTLEHGIMDEAQAVTGFSPDGDGLVRLVVDGQVVQLLGSLAPEDRAAGVRVRAGDRLTVEAVDASRQRCTVSRLGPA
ncbi:MAG TPA: hypothetical protein VFW66_00805 [Gemmatimonadales bacterium]|nr:hypothetical protein [Gemmatimonadales bacterium]